MVQETFTRRLRAYRKLKLWTQHELARQLGVSVAVVGGLERGTRIPTDSEIEQIIELLDVTRSELGLMKE